MQRRGFLVDAVVATVVLGWTLLMIANNGLGTPDPSARGLDGLGVLLTLASALPLLARRTAPAAVYAITATATLALLALHYPIDVPVGAAVSAYWLSLAYSANPSAARRLLAMAAVVAFTPAVTLACAAAGVRVLDITTELLAWWAIFAGIWLVGDRARLRREQLDHLRERVRRAEHDAERERRLAAAEERTRIARELHDSAGHAINVILVQAGAARLLHERDPQRSRAAIGTIEDIARSTINEIDQLVRALRDDTAGEPPPADPGALEELIARHRASGLDVETRLDPPPRPLPHSVAWAAYRILQEALTNAARHGTGRADVTVRSGPQAVEIAVTNPTRAGAAARPSPGGHGIIGMRERVTLLGGSLHTSADTGSFHLHARLPINGTSA
jgi:signal transduction histidine kinase